MPDSTLEAFADHGVVGDMLPADGGDCDQRLARFTAAGIGIEALVAQLQDDGARAFVDSWHDLIQRIDQQIAAVA